MERLGFGPEELRAINPRLIYAFGSAYGPTGPYRDKGGQDVLAQAMSGIAARRPDPGAPPEPCATPIADFTAGMFLVQAILLALLARGPATGGSCMCPCWTACSQCSFRKPPRG
jgi:crotonobetainyl-CoA:carnitine CoA-transferase CaiB-like acyl-CoA transferase